MSAAPWKKQYLEDIADHNKNAHDEWMRVRRLLRAKNHKMASKAIDQLVFLLNERLGPAVADLAVKEERP